VIDEGKREKAKGKRYTIRRAKREERRALIGRHCL